MKKIIAIIGLCLLIQSAFAQNGNSKYVEKRARKYTNEIIDYVSDITAEQQQQLLDINILVTRQFDSLKNLELESMEYKPAARGIFKSRDAAIKKVLNASQYDEFLMLQEEKKEAAYKKKNEKKLKPNTSDSVKVQ